MQVTPEILDEWRRQAGLHDDNVKRCASCRHVEPQPLAENGARVPPDGLCRLLNVSIENVNARSCRGWQDSFHSRRERASTVHAEVRRKKDRHERHVDEVRAELAKRAPSIKKLRKLLGSEVQS